MTEKLHIVSMSGGMGSFAEAHMVAHRYGRKNTQLLFADTQMEDEDLYRFLDEAVDFLGVKLITISDGRTPWEVFRDRKFIGNSRKDPCSEILKRKLIKKYIVSTYQPNQIQVHVGIDYSECHRLPGIVERYKPYEYRSTLVEDGRIIQKDYSEKFGIRRPYLYEIGMAHNNCGGFCVKAGLGQFKMLYEKLPERYAYHENKEQELIEENNKLKPFLKKQVKNKKFYLTMKDYRVQYLEQGLGEEDKWDIGGCNCAL